MSDAKPVRHTPSLAPERWKALAAEANITLPGETVAVEGAELRQLLDHSRALPTAEAKAASLLQELGEQEQEKFRLILALEAHGLGLPKGVTDNISTTPAASPSTGSAAAEYPYEETLPTVVFVSQQVNSGIAAPKGEGEQKGGLRG